MNSLRSARAAMVEAVTAAVVVEVRAPPKAALAPRGATRRRRAVVEQAAAAAPQLQAHHGFAGSRQQLGVGGRGRRVGRELWVRAWRAECVDGAATRAVEAANRAVQAAPTPRLCGITLPLANISDFSLCRSPCPSAAPRWRWWRARKVSRLRGNQVASAAVMLHRIEKPGVG